MCIVYVVYKMQSLNIIIQYLTVIVCTTYAYILQGIYTKTMYFLGNLKDYEGQF